jgi:hypothetical protein
VTAPNVIAQWSRGVDGERAVLRRRGTGPSEATGSLTYVRGPGSIRRIERLRVSHAGNADDALYEQACAIVEADGFHLLPRGAW